MRRSSQPELLDFDAAAQRDWLRGNLRDMARYNRWTRVHSLVDALAADLLAGRRGLTGLDVGVGQGDLIRHSRMIRWTGLDASSLVLSHTREGVGGTALVCGLAQHLPVADASFDVVVSTHTLHHLEPAAAIAFLRECSRAARRGVVIVDLARSVVTLVGAWALTRATSRNPLTLNDGVHSARRAYSLAETRQLASAAGWADARARLHGGVRLSLTLRRV